MSEQQIIKGSVEIITGGGADSAGLVLEIRDVADIPPGVGALRSLRDFAAIDPPEGSYADAAWTATTATGAAALVLWREERPFDLLVSARAMGLIDDAGPADSPTGPESVS